jgi:hypothetical protein
MTPFYAIDRSPDVVLGRGHPAIMAWHQREARDGFVRATPSAHKATKKEAEVLCKEWYCMTLIEALRKGLI